MLGGVRTCNRDSVLVPYVRQNSGSYLCINWFVCIYSSSIKSGYLFIYSLSIYFCPCLFICGLFKDAASSLDYTASNSRISKWAGKDKKGTGCGLISSRSPALDCREENHEISPKVLGFRTKTTLLTRRKGLDDAQNEAGLTLWRQQAQSRLKW